ncbi:hypothetical protein BpHYR1_005222 [Brachionus plicatilis]|uniref:Uncharacterized protein n=1 Tax=Brachionus plicatilis TaxID=10195 RepID=A0A3M7RG35_BRAPC|nr:hypothetical protein BpHYR1_005222 [Brachionus plicatilis]
MINSAMKWSCNASNRVYPFGTVLAGRSKYRLCLNHFFEHDWNLNSKLNKTPIAFYKLKFFLNQNEYLSFRYSLLFVSIF